MHFWGHLFHFLMGIFLTFIGAYEALGDISKTRASNDLQAPFDQPLTGEFTGLSIGHNVSPSGKTLRKGQLSVGTFYVGAGLTNQWTIGFSPFVWTTYKMQHFGSRYAFNLSQNHRLLVSGDYFKTYGEESKSDKFWREACENHWYEKDCARGRYPWGFTSFKMEAWSIKLTDSVLLSSNYRLNLTASYYYYIDDEKPFSLRMDPQNSDPFALAVTTLHELRINPHFFWNLEGGVWGLNYTYPYLHLGSTLNFQISQWLIGAGASTTLSPSFPADKARRFAGYQSQQAIHPEIQVQKFF